MCGAASWLVVKIGEKFSPRELPILVGNKYKYLKLCIKFALEWPSCVHIYDPKLLEKEPLLDYVG